jgi:hypothetical protein
MICGPVRKQRQTLKFRTPRVAQVIDAISNERALTMFKQINENAKDLKVSKKNLN